MDALYNAHARFDDLDLGTRSQWVGKGNTKNQHCVLSATKPAKSIKLATTIGHFLQDRDLDFANVFQLVQLVFINLNVNCGYLYNNKSVIRVFSGYSGLLPSPSGTFKIKHPFQIL